MNWYEEEDADKVGELALTNAAFESWYSGNEWYDYDAGTYKADATDE